MSQKRFPARVVECRMVTTIELENGLGINLIGARIPRGTIISLLADKIRDGNEVVNFGGYEVLYRPHSELPVHAQTFPVPTQTLDLSTVASPLGYDLAA